MNCKPGDLAIVAHAPDKSPMLQDRIVTVERLANPSERLSGFSWFDDSDGYPIWVISGRSLEWAGDFVGARPIADWRLRPIRDPGDDAVDEVLQRLGTPSKETA